MVPRISEDTNTQEAKWSAAAKLAAEAAPLCDGIFVGDHFQTHWMNFASGEKIVELVNNNVTPRSILTRAAFENAIRVDLAPAVPVGA